MRFLLALLLSTLLAVEADNQFISPKFLSTAEAPGRWGHNPQWELGSSELVAFQTSWGEYRIELWQQKLGANAAKLSSSLVYNQPNDGKILAQSFYWTVQTYELLLSDSPIFFFWLRDNKNSSAARTSAYFNITIRDDSISSSNPTTSIAPTRSTSLSTSAVSEASAASAASTETSSSISSPSEHMITNNELSTGAKAGIGVGVGTGVLLVAITASFACFWRRKKYLQEQYQQHPIQYQLDKQQQPPAELQSPSRDDPHQTRPITEYDQSRAELSA
ncbi:hypothetical protein ANO14919_003870 [Xylariales sp. No.14919]|nr:hypothetical protein ANO14919_003870 [Xylariales sp. No.14919]